ncbi:MAG TPA: hypothetical protein VIS96_11390 [Terrimicrobiaceae bacterium]
MSDPFVISSRDEFMGDWGPILTEDQLKRLAKAIGKTGTAAKNFAGNYTDITIKRADADTVFMRSTLPRIRLWAAKTFFFSFHIVREDRPTKIQRMSINHERPLLPPSLV